MADHEVVQSVLHGRWHSTHRTSKPRLVKVFVASTNNDFVEERKVLLESVGPEVQSELETLGIEVEIVDIFFGSEDEFVWDNRISEDHLRELKHSYNVSRGCFLLCLVGGKSSRGVLNPIIPIEKFEQMIKVAPVDDKVFLTDFYTLEDGYYQLKRPKRGEENWNKTLARLEEALHLYLPELQKPLLEEQLEYGLSLSKTSNERIVVVMRNWKGYDESQDPQHIFGDPVREKETEALKKMIYNTIPEENRFSFRVAWGEGGIDPDRDDHETYLADFGEVLVAKLHELATMSIKQDPEVKAKNKNHQEVYNEAFAHLSVLKQYRIHDDWTGGHECSIIRKHVQLSFIAGLGKYHAPLIVHGSCLSGKTSLVNAVFEKCERWVPTRVDRIIRYCGTTPRSMYNLELVRIICQQLCFLLNRPFLTKELSYEPDSLYKWFLCLLKQIQVEDEERVVVILLDDIDRMNPLDADNEAALSWLPISLPHNVFIIATTTKPVESIRFNVEQKEYFSKRQSLITLNAGHTLDCFSLGIEQRLDMGEARFGRKAFSKFCKLLTCTQFGLSEMELLEVLMPTNDIRQPLPLANGFITFSTLASIKIVMNGFLTERQISGKLVILWGHVFTKEAIKKRYGATDVLRKCHAELADLFFLDISQAGKKDPVVVPEVSEETKETPFQSAQPVTDVAYNIRHVEEAWIHLLKAGPGSHAGLKDLCVCNFDMALACVQSISVGYLRCLLEQVRRCMLDRDLELVYQTIRKSAFILTHDAMQLPTQLICWLRAVTEESGKPVFTMVTSAMAWCDGFTEPLLVPLTAWLEPPMPHKIRRVSCNKVIELMVPTPSNQHIAVVPFEMSNQIELWHTTTNELVHTLKGHTGKIRCISVTKLGSFLLTGGEDTTVHVWDLKRTALHSVVREHIATVLCVCSALANTVVVSGGEDCRIIMSNFDTGEALAKVDHHRGLITSLQVTSTGDEVVSASTDSTICLWALERQGMVLLNTMQLTSPIRLMSITDDDVFVLACSDDYSLYLRTLTTGTELHILRGPKVRVASMTFTCDGQRAVVGCADGKVYVIDLGSGETEQIIEAGSEVVSAVTVSQRDNFLVAASGKDVTLFSFRQDKLAPPNKSGPKHHSGRVTCLTVSKDGLLAATGGTDTLVNIWQLNTHELQYTMEGHLAGVLCVSLSPNGLFAVSGGEDNMARVWGLTLGLTVSVYRKHTSPVVCVVAMFDSRRVLSLEANGTAAVWVADDASPIRVLVGLTGKIALVTNVMNYAVTSLSENTLRIWSLTNEDEKYAVSHSEPITCCVITADNSLLITGSKDQSLKVWTIKHGKLTQVLVGHQDEVTCVAVSLKDKAQVISGCRDMNLILWELETGAELFTLSGHSAPVTAVAISADSLVAVSGSEDKTIVAWNTKTGRPLSTLMLHVPIRRLEMATDASRIAVHLADSSAMPIICLHNTPASYVKMPTYIPPAKDVPPPDLRPSSALKRPARRLLKKEVSLDTYTWQKKYAHLTSNIMMAAVDERLKRKFSVCQSASMEEISKLPDTGSQQLGPEQAALAQSQHFDQLEALWNKRSPPRRRGQLSKQNSRQSDPPTPLEEDSAGLSDS